jgi:Family of unknown function (DUF6326)
MRINSDGPVKLDTKTLLSSLWIVVAINILMADILALYIPGTADELVRFAGGTPIAQLMLGGAVMIEISILMIVLSRVLQQRVNRVANIVASSITIAFVIGGGSTYPHYLFAATVEVICLLLLIWIAWTWTKED